MNSPSEHAFMSTELEAICIKIIQLNSREAYIHNNQKLFEVADTKV